MCEAHGVLDLVAGEHVCYAEGGVREQVRLGGLGLALVDEPHDTTVVRGGLGNLDACRLHARGEVDVGDERLVRGVDRSLALL